MPHVQWVCWEAKARFTPFISLRRGSILIVLSGTSHPTRQLRLSYLCSSCSAVIQLRASPTELASCTMGVLGGQSEVHTIHISRESVHTDCTKWKKPSDSSTTAIVSVFIMLRCNSVESVAHRACRMYSGCVGWPKRGFHHSYPSGECPY